MLIVRALAVLLIGLIATIAWPEAEKPEPIYEGRKLTEWLWDYGGPQPNTDLSATAFEVIQKIGTNTVPLYTEWLRYQPSPIRETRSFLARICNELLGTSWNPTDEGIHRSLCARFGFNALSTRASSAVPALSSIAIGTSSSFARDSAILSLANIGPPAITAFVALMTNSNPAVRASTALQASKFGSNALITSKLIELLRDQNFQVRKHVTNALADTAKAGARTTTE